MAPLRPQVLTTSSGDEFLLVDAAGACFQCDLSDIPPPGRVGQMNKNMLNNSVEPQRLRAIPALLVSGSSSGNSGGVVEIGPGYIFGS